MVTHEKECLCTACSKGPDVALLEQQEMMEKFGWIVHFIYENHEMHTHGLAENFYHPDIEILFPFPDPKLGHSLLCNVIDLIESGQTFRDGVLCNRIVSNMNVKFVDAIECGRPVLRMILPDPQGEVDEDKMDEAYARQYDNLMGAEDE